MRTTKKYGEGLYLYDCESPGEARRKLGQLEDIEEKFGIDLITLFKALTNGIYVRIANNCIKYFSGNEICFNGKTFTYCCHENYICKLKDYGQKEAIDGWALTKEELE